MFVAKPLHSAFWLISACRTLPLFQMLLLTSASYRRCCPFFLRLAFIGPPLLRPTLPFKCLYLAIIIGASQKMLPRVFVAKLLQPYCRHVSACQTRSSHNASCSSSPQIPPLPAISERQPLNPLACRRRLALRSLLAAIGSRALLSPLAIAFCARFGRS